MFVFFSNRLGCADSLLLTRVDDETAVPQAEPRSLGTLGRGSMLSAPRIQTNAPLEAVQVQHARAAINGYE